MFTPEKAASNKTDELNKLYELREEITKASNAITSKGVKIRNLLGDFARERQISAGEDLIAIDKKMKTHEDQLNLITQQYNESGLEEKYDAVIEKIAALEIELYGKICMDSPSSKSGPRQASK